MNDQPTSSGSRWEPTNQTDQTDQTDQPTDVGAAEAAEPTYPGPTYPGPTYPGPTYPGLAYATASSRIRGRNRAIIAGVAVGLLGVGGLGAFAIGAATAGGSRGDETSVVDVNGPFGDDGDLGGGLPPGSDQQQQRLPRFEGDDQGSAGTDPGSRT